MAGPSPELTGVCPPGISRFQPPTFQSWSVVEPPQRCVVLGAGLDAALHRRALPRGVQLLALGVIGEYLGRVYWEVKRRPLYLVKERLAFDARREDPAA
jgi:hypothetical protein